jgi:hypothetical protein
VINRKELKETTMKDVKKVCYQVRQTTYEFKSLMALEVWRGCTKTRSPTDCANRDCIKSSLYYNLTGSSRAAKIFDHGFHGSTRMEKELPCVFLSV